MSYNSRNPIVTFRLTAYAKGKLEKLASAEKTDTATFTKSLVNQFLDGDLIKNEKTTEQEIQKLKMEKLKEEIRYLKIKNDFAENFDKPISQSATRIIKPAVKEIAELGQSPYDSSNKRLQCTSCGVLFLWNSFDEYLQQMKEFKNHVLAKHNREFSALEKNVIDNLKFEGKSK